MFKAVITDDSNNEIEVVEGENGVIWGNLDPAKILKLALCNDSGEILIVIDKPTVEDSSFQEFIQYKTAHVKGFSLDNMNTEVVAQVGGWTDGKFEYVAIVDLITEKIIMQTLPRTHFHSKSVRR
jgi:hypothetical protein